MEKTIEKLDQAKLMLEEAASCLKTSDINAFITFFQSGWMGEQHLPTTVLGGEKEIIKKMESEFQNLVAGYGVQIKEESRLRPDRFSVVYPVNGREIKIGQLFLRERMLVCSEKNKVSEDEQKIVQLEQRIEQMKKEKQDKRMFRKKEKNEYGQVEILEKEKKEIIQKVKEEREIYQQIENILIEIVRILKPYGIQAKGFFGQEMKKIQLFRAVPGMEESYQKAQNETVGLIYQHPLVAVDLDYVRQEEIGQLKENVPMLSFGVGQEQMTEMIEHASFYGAVVTGIQKSNGEIAELEILVQGQKIGFHKGGIVSYEAGKWKPNEILVLPAVLWLSGYEAVGVVA